MSREESFERISHLHSRRQPLPPFKYNVYVGHSFNDAAFLSGENSFLDKLEKEFQVMCYPRHLGGNQTSSVSQEIGEGVSESEKCLLVMTKDYFHEDQSHYEIQRIHNKAKRYSCDMIIILWLSQELQRTEQEKFREYINIPIQADDLTNAERLQLTNAERLETVVNAIYQPLGASLMCLPKENIGYGAATGFFYGFLRLVLPDFRRRFQEAILTNPCALPNMKGRSVKKMLIILPRSCFCTISLQDEKKIANVEGFYVLRNANRAGNVKRDYKSSVYKLTNEKAKDDAEREFFFAGELATPLLTMYESYLYGLIGMTKDQLYAERDAFCYTLYQVLQNPANNECNSQYRLIMWDDTKTENGVYKTNLFDLLLPILQEELVRERSEDLNTSFVESNSFEEVQMRDLSAQSGTSENKEVVPESERTYEIDKLRIQNLAALYERQKFNWYHLRDDIAKNGFRGRALIINIINFETPRDPSLVALEKRNGAEKDGEMMENLMRNLGFEVDIYTDINRERLDSLLLQYNKMDHSKADAFICCIMTHGKLGRIYTADCRSYGILSVVEHFSAASCPTLRGKPKVFFIQSCQRNRSENDNTSPYNHLEIDKRGQSDALQPDSVGVTGESNETNTPDCEVAIRGGEQVSAGQPAVPVPLQTDPSSHESRSQGSPHQGSSRSSSSSFEHIDAELRATLVPGEPDFLMSYSALPGSESYRLTNEGSFYIRALDQNLRKDQEIDRALKQVTADVAANLKTKSEGRAYQLPFHLTTGMSKFLYLIPPKK